MYKYVFNVTYTKKEETQNFNVVIKRDTNTVSLKQIERAIEDNYKKDADSAVFVTFIRMEEKK